mmetsp:Transcript_42533/g.95623  ORF Transcript_42533/g.95623 Transcript_42533/m.95623 type:complete len:321 (+) Transcript_42533:96-1058(+)
MAETWPYQSPGRSLDDLQDLWLGGLTSAATTQLWDRATAKGVLLSPPGLRFEGDGVQALPMPTQGARADAATEGKDGCQVCIVGLPNEVLTPAMLPAVLQQAGLQGVVLDSRSIPGEGSATGKAMLKLAHPYAVKHCISHFSGCEWVTGVKVSVSAVPSTGGSSMKHATAKPFASRCTGMPLQLSVERQTITEAKAISAWGSVGTADPSCFLAMRSQAEQQLASSSACASGDLIVSSPECGARSRRHRAIIDPIGHGRADRAAQLVKEDCNLTRGFAKDPRMEVPAKIGVNGSDTSTDIGESEEERDGVLEQYLQALPHF